MPSEIFRCEPCNYEETRVNFGAYPPDHRLCMWKDKDKPCPACGGKMAYKGRPEKRDYYTYLCWISEGGCGSETEVQFPRNKQTEEFACIYCGKMAKLKMQAPTLLHSGNSTKGTSIDVVIGRDAEKRWEKIHERTEIRNKVRKEAGTGALTAIGMNEYKPITGGQLKAVTVPNSTINNDEKG